MEAGRELDALVAEKVMGWQRCSVDDLLPRATAFIVHASGLLSVHEGGQSNYSFTFYPSIDMTAAWRVVEQLRKAHYSVILDSTQPGRTHSGGWYCTIQAPGHDPDMPGLSADTAPLAICLAALHAVGYQEVSGQ